MDAIGRGRGLVACAWLVAAGCSERDAEGVDARTGLAPTELLVRASLDLRGVRPSADELDAVRDDPERVGELVAGFVDDPAFGERMKDVFAGAFRTRTDFYPPFDSLVDEEYEVDEQMALYAAIGEEPLELLAVIALNDRPLTELLRSPVTYVDPSLLPLWPLEEVEPEPSLRLPPGVVAARYVDGRPEAGVLGMNSLFWRHSSTVENANRGRANALSQALLCQSYLDRPIDFPSDLDLTDSESIRHAIATNAACQGCHSTLDPLASYLWGYVYPEAERPQPHYVVEQERAWQIHTDARPAYFGRPGERLVDLAEHVAEDERFVGCAVRRVYEGMLGRKARLEDEGALAVHREAFLSGGLTLQALVRSILEDPSYRGEAWSPRFGGEPAPVYEKVAPVGVLGRSLTHLTGYEMRFVGRSATSLDLALRSLAGGSDRGDTTNVSTGAVLVQRRLAEAGAIHAVTAVLEGRDGGGTLHAFLADRDLDAAPTRAQLVGLVRLVRSRARSSDDAEIEALAGVWDDVAALSGPHEAWIAVVTATLADPDHLLY
ncbi:DUF1588 domain-containing protein [Paraliomyxa miuraensis]|uniref:DUF1588 domain-containing protein n=1 Tax=Paraliomyxa miuraensis TaxID=376150 RepID=UPI00225398A2|nr:DUF1588 domain-containing protein [Paraliomyxa miuraensis]MCX4245973.1 DUF1588 domain-containing protein [Paraliomyxa miuraensis]